MTESKSVKHLGNIKIQGEWETPWPTFEMLCLTYKVKPVLDVCATAQNTKCPHFYTKEENGLEYEWRYDFWMNPMYDEVAVWIAKAAEQARKHNVTGIALTYAKTDTKWWHTFIEGHNVEVHFLKGRIRFMLPPKKGSDMQVAVAGKHSAPYPSVVLIWRKK